MPHLAPSPHLTTPHPVTLPHPLTSPHLSRILVWTSCLTSGGSLSTACWNVNTHWAALSWRGSNSSTWLVILFRYVVLQVRSDSLTFDTFTINHCYFCVIYIGMGSAHISFGIMSLKQILFGESTHYILYAYFNSIICFLWMRNVPSYPMLYPPLSRFSKCLFMAVNISTDIQQILHRNYSICLISHNTFTLPIFSFTFITGSGII